MVHTWLFEAALPGQLPSHCIYTCIAIRSSEELVCTDPIFGETRQQDLRG